ncbi:MAG TPA: phosphoribosylformylglycinamidine synthase subunit PurS [Abditibacteriaceae bacterium]|jgi:phosphoribosylformylglycinamidine synthase
MAIAEIHVTLKPTLLDAQGATVLKALRQLGHGHVHNVRIGKHIEVEFDDALSGSALQSELELMCRQLLSNPVIEDYSITVGGAPIGAPASAATPPGIGSVAVSPLAAVTDVNTTAGSVATTDVVPNPQPLRSSSATTPEAQPAQFEAARISAPQPVVAPTLVSETATVIVSSTPSAMPEAVSSTRVLPDPFVLPYTDYQTMNADDRLSLQGLVWERHGVWILNELNTRRAAWILCIGQNVVESGDSIDSYPSDSRLETLGAANDLVPYVFTRPPQQ